MTNIILADIVELQVSGVGTGNLTIVARRAGTQDIDGCLPIGSIFAGTLRDANGIDFETGVFTRSGASTIERTTVYDSTNKSGVVNGQTGDSAVKIALTNSSEHTFRVTVPAKMYQQLLDSNNPNWQTLSSGDATPSVAHYRLFKTAGTTTITAFDDMEDGKVFYVLRGANDITIANGASIALADGADVTLTADYPAIGFVNDGGVARQITRSGVVTSAYMRDSVLTTETAELARDSLQLDDDIARLIRRDSFPTTRADGSAIADGDRIMFDTRGGGIEYEYLDGSWYQLGNGTVVELMKFIPETARAGVLAGTVDIVPYMQAAHDQLDSGSTVIMPGGASPRMETLLVLTKTITFKGGGRSTFLHQKRADGPVVQIGASDGAFTTSDVVFEEIGLYGELGDHPFFDIKHAQRLTFRRLFGLNMHSFMRWGDAALDPAYIAYVDNCEIDFDNTGHGPFCDVVNSIGGLYLQNNTTIAGYGFANMVDLANQSSGPARFDGLHMIGGIYANWNRHVSAQDRRLVNVEAIGARFDQSGDAAFYAGTSETAPVGFTDAQVGAENWTITGCVNGAHTGDNHAFLKIRHNNPSAFVSGIAMTGVKANGATLSSIDIETHASNGAVIDAITVNGLNSISCAPDADNTHSAVRLKGNVRNWIVDSVIATTATGINKLKAIVDVDVLAGVPATSCQLGLVAGEVKAGNTVVNDPQGKAGMKRPSGSETAAAYAFFEEPSLGLRRASSGVAGLAGRLVIGDSANAINGTCTVSTVRDAHGEIQRWAARLGEADEAQVRIETFDGDVFVVSDSSVDMELASQNRSGGRIVLDTDVKFSRGLSDTNVLTVDANGLSLKDSRQVRAGDGTAGSPVYSYTSDATSGNFLNGVGNPAVSNGGVQVAEFGSSNLNLASGVGVSVDTVQIIDGTGTLKLRSYTVAAAPSASEKGAGAMIYVSDDVGGAVLAFSDGTNWRRVTDRAVISTT